MHQKQYQDQYQGRNSPYQPNNDFHHRVAQKATTLITNQNQMNRNNYHYNYSPSNSTNSLLSNQQNSKTQEGFYRNQQYNPSQEKREQQKREQQKRDPQSLVLSPKPLQGNFSQNKFSRTLFHNTYKLLDVGKFVDENVKLRKRLLMQLQAVRARRCMQQKSVLLGQEEQVSTTLQRDNTPKRQSQSREKSLNLYQHQKINQPDSTPHSQENHSLTHLLQLKLQKQHQIQQHQNQLTQLKKKNHLKRQQIQKLQSQLLHQSIHQTPLLKQKQQAIEYLSVEIQWLNEKSIHLKKLTNSKFAENNIFQMYEQMCRQCETLRKDNNRKSQKLKKLFEKTNKLTGKEENVNMFLMNLKV